MCSGIFGGGKPAYIPPPSKPDPSIALKLDEQRKTGLVQQQEATKARKAQLLSGYGRRSLLSSSGSGFLTNTKPNTNLG
mgnify:CR=1 FL=1|tara:strand:+ start:307 stop:543 length:237 start_codon:yes stop_codon:yes gene_type:complete